MRPHLARRDTSAASYHCAAWSRLKARILPYLEIHQHRAFRNQRETPLDEIRDVVNRRCAQKAALFASKANRTRIRYDKTSVADSNFDSYESIPKRGSRMKEEVETQKPRKCSDNDSINAGKMDCPRFIEINEVIGVETRVRGDWDGSN